MLLYACNSVCYLNVSVLHYETRILLLRGAEYNHQDMIRADLEYYLNYDGDEKPTDEMVEYANKVVDEYTAMLIEEGIV